MIRLLSFCVILSLILPGAVWGGKLFKWTDQEGKVHYSDTPLQGAQSKDLAVKKALKRRPKLTLPSLSNRAIQTRMNRGESWDTLLPPAPPVDAVCQRLESIPDSGDRFEKRKDCIFGLEVRQKYEEKKLARMDEFYSWKQKQDSANQDALEKIERERYLVQKERETLENLKAQKEYLSLPGNVATSDPLTFNNQRDIALQRFKNGQQTKLELPNLTNEDIQARLGRGEVLDTLLPPAPQLPQVCQELDLIPDFSTRNSLKLRCEYELDVNQSYEKKKLERIKKYFAWKDSQTLANRELPRDANKAELDRLERDSYLLKKEKEALEKLRWESGVQN